MTLRRRLVLLTVGLSALALLTAGIVGSVLVRSFAVRRVDQQLVGFANRRPIGPDNAADFVRRCPTSPTNAQGVLFEVYRSGVAACAPESATDPGGGPNMTVDRLAHTIDKPFTVPGKKNGHSYRVIVQPLTANAVSVRAIDLADVQAAWREQILVTIVGSVLVLGAVGGIGLLLIRRDLRPLERITLTADAIAQGDRSHRVDVDDTTSEVGRLGTAFNTMLSSIETSFAEQQRTEDKLRRFAADASHELRTPLTSIRGYAELYRAGGAATPERLGTVMRNIEREATRMSGLVDDLLLLSKMDHEQPIERLPVDLANIANDAVDDLRATAPERTVTARVEPGIIVTGDEARLRQVFANLLANVRLHTPDGTPAEVAVRVEGDSAVINVADHGPGVPPAERELVFERFVRLDPSRTRASGGSGLGLAIVRTLVRAHGGSITIEETPGGGATFVARLPLAGASTA